MTHLRRDYGAFIVYYLFASLLIFGGNDFDWSRFCIYIEIFVTNFNAKYLQIWLYGYLSVYRGAFGDMSNNAKCRLVYRNRYLLDHFMAFDNVRILFQNYTQMSTTRHKK